MVQYIHIRHILGCVLSVHKGFFVHREVLHAEKWFIIMHIVMCLKSVCVHIRHVLGCDLSIHKGLICTQGSVTCCEMVQYIHIAMCV